MKLRFGAAAAAVLMLIAGLLSPAARAGTACESEAAQEYLPPLPRGCHKPVRPISRRRIRSLRRGS